MERFRESKGINKFHGLKERITAAEKMRIYWTDKLKSGWTPFTDKSVLYDDNLEYQTVITKYRAAKASNGTFRFFASKYLDSIRHKVEETTISTYRSKLRLFAAWLEENKLNEIDVSAIDQPLMVKFFTFIIEVQELSKQSVDNYRQILIKVFELVRKERNQFIIPCYDLPETKRINESAAQPIHEIDILSFKKEIEPKDPQLWLAISFEFYCFLRPGKELRLLKINDIDFGRGTIRVRVNNAKTNERHVNIPDVFLLELRNEYKLHQYPRNYYVFGQNGSPGNEHLGKNNLRFRFNKFREALNMPEMYKFYSWKHTGNIAADNAGIPRSETQNQNGHASMLTTERYMKNKKGYTTPNIKKHFPLLGKHNFN
jgi:integrase